MSDVTPSLEKVIKDAMDTRLIDVHVALPAKILKYDPAKQMVDVEPTIQRKLKNGDLETLPVINNVPLVIPRSDKGFLSLPLASGDTVLLVFSERSLDKWKSAGGKVDPADPRKHDLSDAIAIPGLFPFSKKLTNDNLDRDVVLGHGSVEVRAQQTKVQIQKKGSNATQPMVLGTEIKAMLNTLLQKISATELKLASVQTQLNGQALQLVAQMSAIGGHTHPGVLPGGSSTGPSTSAAVQAAGATAFGLDATAFAQFMADFTLLKADIDALKLQYIDTQATDILSTFAFTERGT